MNNMKLKVRDAQYSDAQLIATVVCMAVGYDATHPLYPVFEELARRDDTQYSWRNTLVAELNDVAVGAIVGYDGALLHELRRPTTQLIKERMGSAIEIEDETEAGEFYLDSLGVLPQYRDLGVGRELIVAMRDRAFAEGFDHVGLIVDVDNPNAERLYLALGFRRVGRRRFLGHDMWHLQVMQNDRL